MLNNNICLSCLLNNYFHEDQLELYLNGEIEVTTGYDDVCECCGEFGPIVTSYEHSPAICDYEELYRRDYDG